MDHWLRRWKGKGFSPGQAAAHWAELQILASPILFSRAALRRDPRLIALAGAHRHLAGLLTRIETPVEWIRYCDHHSIILAELSEHIQTRWPGCGDVLKDYWPVIAMDEGSQEYQLRLQMGKGVQKEFNIFEWEALENSLVTRHALMDLVEQDQDAYREHVKSSWQSALQAVGLRSIRWAFGDDPGPPEKQWPLMSSLRSAQYRLGRVVGWAGPLLGLAGSTSLALSGNRSGHGLVQPDPKGPGQTMTLSHWSVLAHEWLHTLDINLARHYQYEKSWATQVMLGWTDHQLPPVPMMAWGLQLSLVMGVPKPELFLPQIKTELEGWEDRVISSLGGTLAVQEELRRQKFRIESDTWTQEDAVRGWRNALSSSEGLGDLRTAYLISSDTRFVLDTRKGKQSGSWSEFMDSLRREAGSLSIPGLVSLLSPVEVMARSFEASLASLHHRPGGLVWIPSSQRPNAGLLWPLPSEAVFQARGWDTTLNTLRPLWAQWKRGL